MRRLLRASNVPYAISIVAAIIACYAAGQAYSTANHSRLQTRNIAVLTSELKTSVQSPTHGKDIALWCNGINSIINYERQYTKGTLKQSESEATTIEKAIAAPDAHGLTAEQAAFIRLYLGSVVALEREVPRTLSLHPFTLGDLNCAKIEAGEKASSKTKH